MSRQGQGDAGDKGKRRRTEHPNSEEGSGVEAESSSVSRDRGGRVSASDDQQTFRPQSEDKPRQAPELSDGNPDPPNSLPACGSEDEPRQAPELSDGNPDSPDSQSTYSPDSPELESEAEDKDGYDSDDNRGPTYPSRALKLRKDAHAAAVQLYAISSDATPENVTTIQDELVEAIAQQLRGTDREVSSRIGGPIGPPSWYAGQTWPIRGPSSSVLGGSYEGQHQQFVTTLLILVRMNPQGTISQERLNLFRELTFTVTEDTFSWEQEDSGSETNQILHQRERSSDTCPEQDRRIIVQSCKSPKGPSSSEDPSQGHLIHGLREPLPGPDDILADADQRQESILRNAGLLEVWPLHRRASLTAKVLIQLLALRLRIGVCDEESNVKLAYLTLLSRASFYPRMSVGIYMMAHRLVEEEEFSVPVPRLAREALARLLFPGEALGGGRFLYAMQIQATQEFEKFLSRALQQPETPNSIGAMWTPLLKLWDAAIGGLLQMALDFVPLEEQLLANGTAKNDELFRHRTEDGDPVKHVFRAATESFRVRGDFLAEAVRLQVWHIGGVLGTATDIWEPLTPGITLFRRFVGKARLWAATGTGEISERGPPRELWRQQSSEPSTIMERVLFLSMHTADGVGPGSTLMEVFHLLPGGFPSLGLVSMGNSYVSSATEFWGSRQSDPLTFRPSFIISPRSIDGYEQRSADNMVQYALMRGGTEATGPLKCMPLRFAFCEEDLRGLDGVSLVWYEEEGPLSRMSFHPIDAHELDQIATDGVTSEWLHTRSYIRDEILENTFEASLVPVLHSSGRFLKLRYKPDEYIQFLYCAPEEIHRLADKGGGLNARFTVWREAILPVRYLSQAPGLALRWSVFNLRFDVRNFVEQGILHLPQSLEVLGNIAAWPFIMLQAVGLLNFRAIVSRRADLPEGLRNMREVNALAGDHEPVGGKVIYVDPSSSEASKLLKHLIKLVPYISGDTLRPVIESTAGSYKALDSLLESSPLLFRLAEDMGLKPELKSGAPPQTQNGWDKIFPAVPEAKCKLLTLLNKAREALMNMTSKLEERVQEAMSFLMHTDNSVRRLRRGDLTAAQCTQAHNNFATTVNRAVLMLSSALVSAHSMVMLLDTLIFGEPFFTARTPTEDRKKAASNGSVVPLMTPPLLAAFLMARRSPEERKANTGNLNSKVFLRAAENVVYFLATVPMTSEALGVSVQLVMTPSLYGQARLQDHRRRSRIFIIQCLILPLKMLLYGSITVPPTILETVLHTFDLVNLEFRYGQRINRAPIRLVCPEGERHNSEEGKCRHAESLREMPHNNEVLRRVDGRDPSVLGFFYEKALQQQFQDSEQMLFYILLDESGFEAEGMPAPESDEDQLARAVNQVCDSLPMSASRVQLEESKQQEPLITENGLLVSLKEKSDIILPGSRRFATYSQVQPNLSLSPGIQPVQTGAQVLALQEFRRVGSLRFHESHHREDAQTYAEARQQGILGTDGTLFYVQENPGLAARRRPFSAAAVSITRQVLCLSAQYQGMCMMAVVRGQTSDKEIIGDAQNLEGTYLHNKINRHPGDVTPWTLHDMTCCGPEARIYDEEMGEAYLPPHTQVLLLPDHYPLDRHMVLIADAGTKEMRSTFFPAADHMAKMPAHRTALGLCLDLQTFVSCRAIVAEISLALLHVTILTTVNVMDNHHGEVFPVAAHIRRKLLANIADATRHINSDERPLSQSDLLSLEWLSSDSLKVKHFHEEANRRAFDKLCNLLNFSTDGQSPFRSWINSYPRHATSKDGSDEEDDASQMHRQCPTYFSKGCREQFSGLSNMTPVLAPQDTAYHGEDMLILGPSALFTGDMISISTPFGAVSKVGWAKALESDFALLQSSTSVTEQVEVEQVQANQTPLTQRTSSAAPRSTLYHPGFAPPPFRPYGRSMPASWLQHGRHGAATQACCRDLQFQPLNAIDSWAAPVSDDE